MNRTVGRVGGLVVSVVAAAPFVYLWVVSMRGADDPLTFRARLDMAIWIAVFGTPWMVAARLLWRAGHPDAGPAPPAAAARAGPGRGRLALAGIAGCLGFTTWYLAEYPLTPSGHPPTIAPTLPPGTAVAPAVLLAGGLWLTLRPPPWLLPDRPARRFGIAMVAGFVLTSRLGLAGLDLADAGMISYLLFATPSVVLAGSVAAAVAGRSFRAGLWACAWATLLGVPLIIAAWLAEAPHWYRQVGGLLLDADGGVVGCLSYSD